MFPTGSTTANLGPANGAIKCRGFHPRGVDAAGFTFVGRMSVGFAHNEKTGAAVLMVVKPAGFRALVVCWCHLPAIHRVPMGPPGADYCASRHLERIQTDGEACWTGPSLETLHRPLRIASRIRAREGGTVSPLCQTHSRGGTDQCSGARCPTRTQ
ncbi:MAG: hypothetical protein J07HR59_00612 [Halorubrum sp. J07HR59]|nr:MAG: hypothetical protein J07HR59_00612 [Halorubrum sp. J07HR59]